MSFETILYDVKEGVCTITINRPDALNALNNQVLNELLLAIQQVKNDNDTKVVILTGAGRAFVSGADIEFMKNLSTKEGLAFADLGQDRKSVV